ncbi:hypothetical protein HH308_29445, partial [Gordonia sp. TBRC 11910]|nr:hypothetical protein [Gordonia asplenii]
RAGPGLDLFPGLARYTFLPTTPTAAATPPRPRATSSRRHCTLRKHHLRKAERDRNRAARLAHAAHPDPTSIYSRLTPDDDGDPPY